MEDFKLIVISRPEIFEGEAEMIDALTAEEGVDYVHIRKPEATDEEVRRLIETTSSERGRREKLTVHYHHRVAKETGCGGVHLSGRCREVVEGWGETGGRVSASCHSIEEVESEKGRCDYVFLSPIFDSISKEGYGAAFTEETIERWAREGKIDRRVVALGGIGEREIGIVRRWGFGGAAVLGAVWKGVRDAREMRERVRTLTQTEKPIKI